MEHSPVPVSLEDLLAQSACGMRRDDHPEPRSQCCCGKPSCAFLVKNDAALDGLERDLQSAAQIGQVRCANASIAVSSYILYWLSSVASPMGSV
jgi:hypothetical protein